MSRSRGDAKQDRKVRETVNLSRPGTAGTTTPPISTGYMAAPAPQKPAVVADDYDDDDFEAYDDDDFEEDEYDAPPSKPVAQAKPAAKGVPGMKPGGHFVEPAVAKGSGGGVKGSGNEMEQLRLSMQSENMAAMEARRAGAKSESPDELRGPAAAYARQFKAASPVPNEYQGSPSPDSRPQATSKNRRTKKFASMDIADEGFAFGPREARLRQLRDANILEMRVDTFFNFNLAPTTKFDTYQRQLRGTPAQITQVGVPFLTEYRDMEVATEPIDMVDKEVQFGFGDETDLLNIIACIKSRREGGRSSGHGESKESRDNSGKRRKGKEQQPSLLEDAGMTSKEKRSDDSKPGDSTQAAGNSLSTFLQRSSLVMESLLVEMELKNLENRNESSKARSSGRSYRSRVAEQADSSPAVFNSNNDWFPLGAGGDNTSGYMEYVRTRHISFIQFSSLQPNVLISGHPPPDDERAAEDLKPNSALYCVWDVTSPASPIRLLSSPGFPTAAAFSAGQSFLVLAGTLEGSLHLWDLRESNSLHIDRDAADLKVYTGVRRACYTAYDHITATSNNASGSSTISQHSAAIVKVESIDTTGGDTSIAVSSQFVTLDEAGFITIWLTSEDVSVANSFADDGDISAAYKGNVGGDNDAEVGLSPQGMVKLVKRRVIAPDCSIFYSHHAEGLLMTPGILPVVAVNPLDPSVLLVSVGKGIVYRGSSSQAQSSHHGHSEHRVVTKPQCYRRTATKSVSVTVSDPSSRDRLDAWAAGDKRFISELDSWSEASYYSPVTCIAPSCTTQQSTDGSYVLVGHADGTVDLYSGKAEAPMVAWSLSAEAEMSDSSGSRGRSIDTGKRGVALLKWLPSSTTAFMAVDTLGAVYVFDLVIDSSHPVEIDSSAEDRQTYRVLHQHGASLSGRPINVGTGSGFLALCRNKTKAAGNGRNLSDGVLLVRRINPALMMTGLDGSKRQISSSDENKDEEFKESNDVAPTHGLEQIPAFNMARDTLQQSKLVYATGDFSSSGRHK